MVDWWDRFKQFYQHLYPITLSLISKFIQIHKEKYEDQHRKRGVE